MRVGKKLTVVQAKKTRSCVVRLEKVNSPPLKVTRSSVSASKLLSLPEKKLKAPLKKRPIAQKESTPTTMGRQPKDKEKMKPTPQKFITKPTSSSVASEELPPTIAAGRSRRAIKPNPKYASEDMVTPKSIKNVGGTPSVNRGDKQRKLSASSLEDFFSKESSDDFDEDIGFASNADKAYNLTEKDSDSDFPDIALDTPRSQKTRQRPKVFNKNVVPDVGKRIAINATPTVKNVTKIAISNVNTPTTQGASKLTPTVAKSAPTQLQQLRKTISGNVNRTSATIVGKKRKLDTHSDEIEKDEENGVTRKRFSVNPVGTAHKLPDRQSNASALQLANKGVTMRRSLNIQTLNGKKVELSKFKAEQKKVEHEKLKALMSSTADISGSFSKFNTKVTRITKTPTQPASTLSKAVNAKQFGVGLKRSASPVAAKPVAFKIATTLKKESPSSEKAKTELSPSDVDDFEVMPTFTIVNINDIINKKGDVLITKTVSKSATSKSSPSPTTEPKSNKRKALHDTIFPEKMEPERIKNVPVRSTIQSPVISKKILSHKLLNKAANVPVNQRSTRIASSLSTTKDTVGTTGKPAPRILNSMVARTTLPVKPMIANLDDSADETFPLSPGEGKNIKSRAQDEDGGGEENTEGKGVTSFGKRQITSSTPFQSFKKTEPATKENLLAATNRIAGKKFQPKPTPERVLISREGNRIIKKITCFETWYVIQMPEERPTSQVRNLLEMPLVKLANFSKKLKLPSSNWNSKVTLFELSAAMLAKSKQILYTGDLKEHNIAEEDRARYQPTSVMFRRRVNDRAKSRLPYDRAVIFKNKTFFTNIEGKNVKLVAAPAAIARPADVEILLSIVDSLTLQSSFVEPATTVQ